MSTRSRIGIKNENGTITSIYCHHDGYEEGVGAVLFENYKSEEKIRKLMELGDMSSLGTEPVSNPNAWRNDLMIQAMRKEGKDFFEFWKELNPDDMCNTYETRGEHCPAKTSENEEAFVKQTEDCWGEYAYLFKDGKWFVYGVYDEDTDTTLDWITVEEALERNKEDED